MWGPLLPKLRGELAKFLNEGSLARLSALTLGHLCRFAVRVTMVQRLEAFLGTLDSGTSRRSGPVQPQCVVERIFLLNHLGQPNRGQPKPGFPYPNASLHHSIMVVQES